MKPGRKGGAPAKADWPRIRAEYEAGGPLASHGELAKRHGVSRQAVQRRCSLEGWRQNLEPAVARAAAQKLAGIVAGGDPEKTQQAIEREAERRASIVERHRAEWGDAVQLRREALDLRFPNAADLEAVGADPVAAMELRRARVAAAFEAMKLAKITTEAIAIQQQGERKAHRLDDPLDPGAGEGRPPRVEIVFVDERLPGSDPDD